MYSCRFCEKQGKTTLEFPISLRKAGRGPLPVLGLPYVSVFQLASDENSLFRRSRSLYYHKLQWHVAFIVPTVHNISRAFNKGVL